MGKYLLLFFIGLCSLGLQAQKGVSTTNDPKTDSLHVDEFNSKDFNATQLLNSHELKSNELYDFSTFSNDEIFEASSETSVNNVADYEVINYGNDPIYQETEPNPTETIFNSNQSKKKKTKVKKKKTGKGILVVTGIVLLLTLLSQ